MLVLQDRGKDRATVWVFRQRDATMFVSFGNPTCCLPVLQDEIFMICLNQRLYRLSRAREPPFFSATLSDEATCNAVDMYVLSASCEEQKVLRWVGVLFLGGCGGGGGGG